MDTCFARAAHAQSAATTAHVVEGVNLCRFDSCSQFIISNNMRTCVMSINKMQTRSSLMVLHPYRREMSLYSPAGRSRHKKKLNAFSDASNN